MKETEKNEKEDIIEAKFEETDDSTDKK